MGVQLLSLVGRILTMDMATGQYIDKRDCFQFVEFFLYVTPGGIPGPDST